MAKNVFRNGEINYQHHKVFLHAPEPPQPTEVQSLESLDSLDEYTGPTADQLRREAEEFKQNWEAEKERMVASATAEAERIVKEAEDEAFRQIKEKTEQANASKHDAEAEAEEIRAKAQNDAADIISEAEERGKKIEADAFERGRHEGRESGIGEGKAEAQRIIERFQIVLNKAIERRNEIIAESEPQVISLVLTIAKKVVKVISENQKNVVVNNIVQSLQKLQQKSDVVVRVNLSDLELASHHKDDILKMAEQVQSITIAEDSTVDTGGALIETDFGEIDARISSQLREIEDRIIELAPIKARPKGSGSG